MIISQEEVRNNPPPQLNISLVAGIRHKIQNFIAIFDLSFKILLNGFKMPLVNGATRYTAERGVIEKLGKVPP